MLLLRYKYIFLLSNVPCCSERQVIIFFYNHILNHFFISFLFANNFFHINVHVNNLFLNLQACRHSFYQNWHPPLKNNGSSLRLGGRFQPPPLSNFPIYRRMTMKFGGVILCQKLYQEIIKHLMT